MKIIYGITKSNFGGAQRYVFDLARAAKAAGHDVVIMTGGNGVLVEKLKKENIRVIEIRGMKRDISLFDEFHSLYFIFKTLLREKPNVFHTNSSKMGGLGNFAARLAGIQRIVFTAHGWPFWEPRNAFARALMAFFSWLTAILAHRVIAVSNYDLAVAKKMPLVGGKAVRIYNGIDLNTTFGTGEVIRQAFPTGAKITGTIGELNRNKNQIALIEEARKNSDMYVAIVGEGELRPFLEEKIKEYGLGNRVKLFGYLPREDVLKGFDTFALPSLKEGLPYVLLEAKLAGLEIKANRSIGGVREILDQNIETFSDSSMYTQTLAQY